MTQAPRAKAQPATSTGERSMIERPQRFRVMRAVQLEAGKTTPPGTIVEQGPNWPYRRAKQFVDQGYLAPIVSEEG
jgi:hypothetical protein